MCASLGIPHPASTLIEAADSAVGAAPQHTALSVVVASFRDHRVVDACLAALLPQCEAVDVELIVARAGDAADVARLVVAYPTIRVVALPRDADVPRLRGAGLAAASGKLAALTEDHCVADAHWVATMRRYLGHPSDVVGGTMDNASRTRAIDWGAFFAEYGFFARRRPWTAPDGAAPLLTGANVAYARRVLDPVASWMVDGAWENVVHDRLRARGGTLVFEPAARVAQNLTYAFGPFMTDRYRHGRDYARARVAESPAVNRGVRAVLALLLPPLLAWRVARTAVDSLGRAAVFAWALPFTLAFLGAWAVGEAVGYVRGPSAAHRVLVES